jgi:hypothetical protein
MAQQKTARAAQQQHSFASGTAFDEYVAGQRDVAPLFAMQLRERPDHPINFGFDALV